MTILGVTSVFFLEVAAVRLLGGGSVERLVGYLFVRYPLPTWVLAPVLHRDVGHWAVNVGMLGLLLPVESSLSKRNYGALFFGAGVVSTYFGGWYLLTFGNEPTVAFYGTSGFVYGLAGFALCDVGSRRRRAEADWVVFCIGISALVVVASDLLAALSSPLALNPGHVFGFVVGVGVWTTGRLVD